MKLLFFINSGNTLAAGFMLYHRIPALSLYYLCLSAAGFLILHIGRRRERRRTLLAGFLSCLLLVQCSPKITPENARDYGWLRVTLTSIDRTGRGYLYTYTSDRGDQYSREIRQYVPSLKGACYQINTKLHEKNLYRKQGKAR